MEIISRKDARENGLTRYFTGKPCKYGHVCKRNTSNSNCIECMGEISRNWGRANPEKRREQSRQYYARNREKAQKRNREWKKSNPEYVREYAREYHRQYYAENRKTLREYYRQWCQDNPDIRAANDANRRASKLQATPDWADQDKIQAVYTEAARLEQETGEPHHVDHIIPLQGEDVCGLHVHYNLRAIPAAENLSKGNRLDSELLETLVAAPIPDPLRFKSYE